MTLLRLTERGLYCEAGDLYVDPWGAVDRAVVTHAHGDHVAWGCRRIPHLLRGAAVLRSRLPPEARSPGSRTAIPLTVNGVSVSLHPAGHILGSAQVRLELNGEVWVVSGDYKTDPDPTATAFEPVRCHTFVTESTFGLPVYRWPPQREVFDDINAWWRANQESGKASLLYGYALGKAQRLLAGLDPGIGPILTHGAVERMTRVYRDAGVPLPPTTYAATLDRRTDWSRAIILAPPSADGSVWTRRFGSHSTGFASGWMLVRGARRRRSLDRGFPLSDHVDWPSLLGAISAHRRGAGVGDPRLHGAGGALAQRARPRRESGGDPLRGRRR